MPVPASVRCRCQPRVNMTAIVNHDELRLPIGVETCSYCRGHGQYRQFWCDAPRMPGVCGICDGAQWVYSETNRGVPESVRQQIAVENGLREDFHASCLSMLMRRMRVLVPPDRKTTPERERDQLSWLFAKD